VTRRVSVRIDELVLDGVDAAPGVESEVRAELARLLRADPPAPQAAERRSVALSPGPVGPAVAQAIAKGIGR
jgi:hypothetical protein